MGKLVCFIIKFVVVVYGKISICFVWKVEEEILLFFVDFGFDFKLVIGDFLIFRLVGKVIFVNL